MESLESKLEKLASDQRREVEDFVDFLLARYGISRELPGEVPTPSQLMNNVPPPLAMTEPVHITMPGQSRETGQDNRKDPPAPGHQELSGGNRVMDGESDQLDNEYIDYGKFEKPSPAAEAVMKVKEKIVKRHEREKSGHILEWID